MIANESSSLIDVLQARASERGDHLAYRFLVTGEVTGSHIEWSYAEMYRRARAIAAILQDAGATGQRVLLLYPPDIEFIAGFMGVVLSGAVAVPTYPPDPARLERTLPRLRAIASDCQAGFVLTSTPVLTMARTILPQVPELSRLRWFASDQLPEGADAAWKRPVITGDTLAFLQYTSGSTGSPKGVMVSHANVHHNERLITLGFGHDANSSGVGWLPLFHDMGLLGNVLQPLYLGFSCTLMSPLAFLARPLRWLEAISRFRATTSGGPNFAYELCLRKVTERDRERLDLRSWTVAFNGAEPVNADTIDRFSDAFASCGFRRQAFYPCYGLAEATLFVTGGDKAQPPITAAFVADDLARHRGTPAPSGSERCDDHATVRLVSSGHAWLDQQVLIVDPETRTPCASDHIGEIWVAGPSVARGYWNLPDESTRTFAAFLAGNQEGPFLRTGDLGFLHDGQLFVTGRLKDMIIIRGRNHYPQDIEHTVERADARIRIGGCACFAVDGGGEERLGVVAEVDLPGGLDDGAGESAADAIIAVVRRAVAEAHDISPHAIALIRPRSLPKTSSGKLQRRACREDFLRGRLTTLATWIDRGAPHEPRSAAVYSRAHAETLRAQGRSEELRSHIEHALRHEVAHALSLDPERIDRDVPITSYGLDSLRAMQLVNQIREQFELELPVRVVFETPTIAQLAAWIETASRDPSTDALPALVRTEGHGPHPLSFAQERLWLLEQTSPRAALYNISISVRLRGPLDVALLARCLTEIMRRHDVLRSYFDEVGGRICQRIATAAPFELPTVDLRALSLDARDAELQRRQEAVAQTAFDLMTAPLVRGVVFRLDDGEHLVLLTMHHSVSDGWSMAVLLRELSALYDAFSRGAPSPLEPLPLQYSDFAAWQTRWLSDAVLEPHAAYWRARLHDAPAPLQIPLDWPRSTDRPSSGRRCGARLPLELTAALEQVAQRAGATLFMTAFAAFALLLHRLTGEHDIVVGTPVSNRPRAEFEGLIGLFLNNVVLRVTASGDATFHELLQQVRGVTLDAYEHRDMPFDKLLHELRRIRPPERMLLYRVFFNMIDFPERKLVLPGLTVDRISSPDAASKMDVSWYVMDTSEGIALEVVYDAAIVSAARAKDMLRQYGGLLAQIAERPAAKLTDYTI
jgi:acyl-CoA synthetase (AMP-forming)/AMP-acid ligase II/aryl carrier-like protein